MRPDYSNVPKPEIQAVINVATTITSTLACRNWLNELSVSLWLELSHLFLSSWGWVDESFIFTKCT